MSEDQPIDRERKERELLALEYERDGYAQRAAEIRRNVGMGAPNFRAVRAISAALAQLVTPDDEAIAHVALAIQRADNEPCPDGTISHCDVSDWGEHLARSALAALSQLAKSTGQGERADG